MVKLPPIELKKRPNEHRLSDSVYNTLLGAILSDTLQPGTIVSEVALAKTLDVSRTPVHDALRQLEKDGLVVQEANRRATIAQFSSEDIFDIFEMRKILERESASRAASQIDRQTLAKLRETALHLQQTAEHLCAERRERGEAIDCQDWVDQWAEFDGEFHDQVAQASGSPRLWRDIARYRQLHLGINKYATTIECLQQALQEHLDILTALENRDPERAARAMYEHIREWQAYFTTHLRRDRKLG